MSTQLVKPEEKSVEYVPFGSADKIKLSVSIIKNIIAVPTKSGKTCDDKQAVKFLMLCSAQHLNPFAGDAFLIGYDGKDGPQFSLITAHQAFLKRAEVSKDFDGMESGVIVKHKETNETMDVEGDFYDRTVYDLVGGWAIVHHKSRKIPTKRRVRLDRFQKTYGVWQDDPGGMICKCFDAQTEVLTTRGFERFANAEGKILQVTERGLEETDSVPFFRPYTGDMVWHKSRNGNFRVTPNHDMPIALNGSPETKMEAGELLKLRQRDAAIMPLSITGSRPECGLDDNTIRVAAAYIADGSDNSGSSGFSIAVSRADKITRLNELGMHTSQHSKKDSGQESTLSTGRVIVTKANKTAFYYSRTIKLTSLVGRNKEINHATLMALSMRQARILIDTWLDYDGHCPARMRCGRVYTSRLNHVRSIELLAVAAGYSVNRPTSRPSDGGKTRYEITVTNRTNIRLSKSEITSVKNETDGVWCVTVPTHKIVVRRNGFSFVCHQCAEADALRSTFPTLLGGLRTQGEVIEVDAEPAAQRASRLVATVADAENGQTARQVEDAQPVERKTEAANTPQQDVEKLLSDAGYSFDELMRYGRESGNIENADSIPDFGSIPSTVCTRLLRAKVGLLKGLESEKAAQ